MSTTNYELYDNPYPTGSKEAFYYGLFKEGGTEKKEDYIFFGSDEKYWDYYVAMCHKYGLSPHKPQEADKCVCKVEIKENVYLFNVVTRIIVVIGNVCMHRYLPSEANRKCIVCGSVNKHMRRKSNICKSCRIKGEEEKKSKEREQKALEEDMRRERVKTRYMGEYTVKVKGKDISYENLLLKSNEGLCTWFLKKSQTDKSFKPYLIRYLKARLHYENDTCKITKRINDTYQECYGHLTAYNYPYSSLY